MLILNRPALLCGAFVMLALAGCGNAHFTDSPTTWQDFYFSGRQVTQISGGSAAQRAALGEQLERMLYEGELYYGVTTKVDRTDLRDMRLLAFETDDPYDSSARRVLYDGARPGTLQVGNSQSQVFVYLKSGDGTLELELAGLFETAEAQEIVDDLPRSGIGSAPLQSDETFPVVWSITGTFQGEPISAQATQDLSVIVHEYVVI